MRIGGSAARRYAEAMHDIALAESAVPAYRASLEGLAAALAGEPIRTLRDPRLPLRRRLAMAGEITRDRPRSIASLIRLLVERDRISLLPAIARAYGALVDRRAGLEKARIVTAVSLSEDERRWVVTLLERASGKSVRATFAEDPALIGGARVQVGDRLIDSSLQAQLDALRARLAS
ncbi:MAG: ATP synthase F1 subunit delta [Candidatus Limnocylindria bacterium]